MYQPLQQRLQHPPDFRVRYRFYTEEEGGRVLPPHQGYRSDFWYAHPSHRPNWIFMIWPEFENTPGVPITNNELPVPHAGTATMWIINTATRGYHRDKIHIGLKSWFMEGLRKVAEYELIEILGLHTNLTESF